MMKRIENAADLDTLVGAAAETGIGVALLMILVGDVVLVGVPLIGVYLDGRFDVALPTSTGEIVTFDFAKVEVFA